MSNVVSISSKYGKVALTDEQVSSLVDQISGLRLEDGLLLWSERDGREIYFNIEPNELWSDVIDTEDDYVLAERIAEHLGFGVFIEDQLAEASNNLGQDKQGCGAACVVLCVTLASLALWVTKNLG